MNNLNKFIALTFILTLAVIFRFYLLQDWINWGMDQEYEAYLVKNIVSGKHLPLIGVNASDTGLYLGPAFIYFAAIPYAIFQGNPVGWGVTASLLGILVCFLIYKIAGEVFTQRVGITSSLLYGCSFLTSYYDRRFWNPMPIPLLSLAVGYLIYLVLNKRTNSLVWLAFVFGLAIQAHLSILIFLPLICLALWLRKESLSRKTMIISLAVFVVLQLPLILFDLRHNFLNTRAIVKLVAVNTQPINQSTIIQNGELFLNALGRFISVGTGQDLFMMSDQCQGFNYFEKSKLLLGGLIIFISIGTIIWQLILKIQKNKRFIFPNVQYQLIIGIYCLILLFILFYNRQVFEYYFLFFFPWLAISLGWVIDCYWRQRFGKIITSLILIIIIILNLNSLLSATYVYSYKNKVEVIAYAKQYVAGKRYSLEAIGDCPRYGGYRYLFDYYIQAPVRSYMDPYFAWLYEDVLDKSKVDYIVLLYLPDPRDSSEKIMQFEEQKKKWMSENKLVASEKIGLTQIYIFTPVPDKSDLSVRGFASKIREEATGFALWRLTPYSI